MEKWGWKKSVDDFLEYWFKAEHNIDKRVTDLIEKLRLVGVKCYLATNQEKYRTEYIRNQMGLGKIFDKIFSSAEVGFKKPQSEFFDKVMNEIGLEKNEVQFWDDTEKNILGAKDFGIDARRYRNFEEFQKEMSSLLTES